MILLFSNVAYLYSLVIFFFTTFFFYFKKKMLIYWQELVNDYEKLFETGKGYDVIIYAGENEDVEEIHAHSTILCARSQYFRAAFFNEWAVKRDGIFIFK